jgi:hypothetical protein
VTVGANRNSITLGRSQDDFTRYRTKFYRTLAGPSLAGTGRYRCEAYVLPGFHTLSQKVAGPASN